jgi:hypothetical protein
MALSRAALKLVEDPSRTVPRGLSSAKPLGYHARPTGR